MSPACASIALHVANRGNITPGDAVAITGAGAIGLLGGDAARIRGASSVLWKFPKHSLKFDFSDPLVSMLGIRYLLEQRTIDVMKWTIFKYTKPGVQEISATFLEPGSVMQRHVRVIEEPFFAIEIPVEVQAAPGRNPVLNVSLIKGTSVVYTRSFTPGDMAALNKIYIPLRPYARLGETVVLRLAANDVRVRLLTGAADVAGDAPLFYGRVTTPLIFDRELPDGRIFRNVGEVPRFHAVTRVRRMLTLATSEPSRV